MDTVMNSSWRDRAVTSGTRLDLSVRVLAPSAEVDVKQCDNRPPSSLWLLLQQKKVQTYQSQRTADELTNWFLCLRVLCVCWCFGGWLCVNCRRRQPAQQQQREPTKLCEAVRRTTVQPYCVIRRRCRTVHEPKSDVPGEYRRAHSRR